jgi:hypothetical protein
MTPSRQVARMDKSMPAEIQVQTEADDWMGLSGPSSDRAARTKSLEVMK